MSKFSPAAVETIAHAIELGAPRKHAAACAGVSYETVRRWMRAGEQDEDSPQGELVRRVDLARGALAMRCLQAIHTAAEDGTWQAAAWVLERRFPDQFGRRTCRDLQPVVPSSGHATDEEVNAMAERIAAAVWQRRMQRQAG